MGLNLLFNWGYRSNNRTIPGKKKKNPTTTAALSYFQFPSMLRQLFKILYRTKHLYSYLFPAIKS